MTRWAAGNGRPYRDRREVASQGRFRERRYLEVVRIFRSILIQSFGLGLEWFSSGPRKKRHPSVLVVVLLTP